MADDTPYRELQQALDKMPVGFPPTESGVEIRILKQLFSPLEARIALCLSMAPEFVSTIQGRLSFEIGQESLIETLEQMAFRGLIRTDGAGRYSKLPFVVGIYEGQVNRMSEQLARDMVEYFDLALDKAVGPARTPQLRTVPVNRPITVERGVACYDDIRESVRTSAGPFAVMNCICRQAQDLAGNPCRQTKVRENCLTMGSAAELMVKHGQARLIERGRVLELLDDADREGLVIQPQNTKNPLFMCLCCGCCCVALKAGKHHARPVDFMSANYYAEVDPDHCDGCGICVERCQMDALAMPAGIATVDLARCIGCGLCVSTCPSEAMALHGKPEPVAPPGGARDLYAKIYRERFGTLGFARTAVKLSLHRQA